jgi:hypothetical protein
VIACAARNLDHRYTLWWRKPPKSVG